MDIKDLKLLLKMVTETDITEFEMDNADEKIVIRRGPTKEYITVAAPVAPVYAPQGAVSGPSAAVMPAPAPSGTAPAPVVEEKGETINSPIVGTFYRAPSPDAAPFVEVGQVVEKGQVLCLVEAMKLFNEIEAEFRCKIVRICKENAQPVEFGDPLYVIERI